MARFCRDQSGDAQPWVTVGVLAEKGRPTASKTGSMFSRWKLSDLDGAAAALLDQFALLNTVLVPPQHPALLRSPLHAMRTELCTAS